ncbi:MAG: zinc ABC transporter substrate-binding protein [Sulfurospirillum sp.]
MLKTIIFSLLILNTFLYAKLNIVVSVLPEVSFVKAIGKNLVNVTAMVKPGDSPHTYEPKPSQMREISKADIYFSIGVEFENAWLKRFANQNSKMLIINLSSGIKKEAMPTFEGKNQHDGGKDPHVWTSPENIKIIAKNIYKALIKTDSKNRSIYTKNYQNFILHIEMVDKKIKNILKNTPRNSRFMVFHPAWGYFAKEYHLIQLPIEIEGKIPKPKSLIKIIKIAKKQKVRAIFTQPEFSPKIATQIARELHVKVIKATPLNPKWEENLISFAKAIAK